MGAVEGDGPGGSHCPPCELLVAGGSGELNVGAEVLLTRCTVVTGGAGKFIRYGDVLDAPIVLPGMWATL